MPDYGTARADFPGGDAVALYRSIRKILSLPPDTRIFVGHDYLPEQGRTGNRWETTVAEEASTSRRTWASARPSSWPAVGRATQPSRPRPCYSPRCK